VPHVPVEDQGNRRIPQAVCCGSQRGTLRNRLVHPAIPALVAHVDAFESDEATALFASIVTEVAGDRERAIETMEVLAEALASTYDDAWIARALGVAFANAWDGTPAGRERALAIAPRIATALADSIDEDGLWEFDADLATRLAGDPRRTLQLRLDIATLFDTSYRAAYIDHNLHAALALATTDRDRLRVATALAAARRRAGAHDAIADIAELVLLANRLAADPEARDAVIRADIEIAASDALLAHQHVSRADELARESADESLRDRATSALAELLFEAELLERADEVASRLPLVNGELPAILEHIRRVRGVLAEPPPEAFVWTKPDDEPESSTSLFAHFSNALPDELVGFFTRSDDLATALARVVSPEKIREWSHGEVRHPADLESSKIFGPVRSYACACGRYLGAKYRGWVCERCGTEIIDADARMYRVAHLVLAEPVVHPWHAATIAALLDMGVREVQRANATELADRLDEAYYGLISACEELRARKANDPRLTVMDAVRASNTKPRWFVLELLPVWPPATTRLNETAAVARAYIDVLDGVDVRTAVNRLFSLLARQLGV
jgi:hypothetical protein